MALSVLLAIDGSDNDARALPVAAALVELAEGASRVVHVAAPGRQPTPEDVVRHTADRLSTATNRETSWDILGGPDVGAALLRQIEIHDPDFVVVATRAAGAVGRAIQGSIADRLVQQSPRPVVLVPPRARGLSAKAFELRRVLVPLDGSPLALTVIPRLRGLRRADELELVLMQVVPPLLDAGAEERLDAVADRLRSRGVEVQVRIVESAAPGKTLIDAVRAERIDMIAMTTRGASGLRRLVLGSVAAYVVRRSDVPVMLVTARSSVLAGALPLGRWR